MSQQTRTAPCGSSRTRTAGARRTRAARRLALLLLGGLGLGLLLAVLTCTTAEADDTADPSTSSPTSSLHESAEADAPPSGTTTAVPASSDRSVPLSTGTSSNDSAATDGQVPEASASAGPSSPPVAPVATVAPVADALAALTAVAFPEPSAGKERSAGRRHARPVAGVPNPEAGLLHRHDPVAATPVTPVDPVARHAAGEPGEPGASVPAHSPLRTLLSQVAGDLHDALVAVPVVEVLAPTVDAVVATTVDLVDTTTVVTARVLRTVSVGRPLAGLDVLGLRLTPVTDHLDSLLDRTATTVAPASSPVPKDPADPAGPEGSAEPAGPAGWSAADAAVVPWLPTSAIGTPAVVVAGSGVPPTVAAPALDVDTAVALADGSAASADRAGSDHPVPAGQDRAGVPAGGPAGGTGTGGGSGGGPVASLLATLDLPAHHGGSRMIPGAWELPGAPSYDPGHSPD